MLIRSEARDPVWAPRSEAALLAKLRTVPGVGTGAPLEARCGSTTCEVTGVAAPGASLQTVEGSWSAIRRITAGDELAGDGLAAVLAELGTGHSEYQFVLYFRRDDRANPLL